MSKRLTQLPRIPHAFFRWYCKPEMYEELHGDLEEFFYDRQEKSGRFKARLWYWWNVARCCQPYSWKQVKGHSNSNIGMLQNFYFTAIRNLLKHRRYAFINILGLAIGIASFSFVALYIGNEVSYDRFHDNHQHIYRVHNEAIIRGEKNIESTTSAPMANALLTNYPAIRQATRIMKSNPLLVGVGPQQFNEDHVIYGEPSLFEVFDFRLIKGNPETALRDPNSMVLSTAKAVKYFGDADPIGQYITVEHDSILYQVTGIVADPPANSHIQFDMIASLSSHDAFDTKHWVAANYYTHTYVELASGTDVEVFEDQIQELFYSGMAPEIEYFTELSIAEWEASGNSVRFKLTPLAEIHLHSEASRELTPPGNVTYLYIYLLIGLIILVIAIFNFVNLATAHSATRAKEVGVRKVIGSSRQTLVIQFMLESVLVSFLATIIGGVIVSLMTPYFTTLIGKELAFTLFSAAWIIVAIVLFSVLVGILAGVYPALILARLRPAQVLKGAFTSKSGSSWLRNFLVTLQFTAAIAIIVVSVVVYFQTQHMLQKNLGFDKEQVLVLERSEWLGNNLEAFKNDLLTQNSILATAKSITVPGRTYDIRSYRRKEEAGTFLFLNNQVSYDYYELMGFELVSGRFFSREFGADSNAVVINEAAAEAFGFDNPLGQSLTSAFKKGRSLKVIGVVKDYHIESLHKSVAPASLELAEDGMSGYVNIKIANTVQIAETLGFIEDVWNQHSNGKPLQYFFLDQQFEQLYQSEMTTGKMLVLFSALSVFIACMGLIGLVAYSISIRQKEIGIRKVLGAGIRNLLMLLSGNIARLVLLAALVAWPVAYFAIDYWLQGFAEKVNVNPLVYPVATGGLILVVGLFLSVQTLRAAHSNPVDSLRNE